MKKGHRQQSNGLVTLRSIPQWLRYVKLAVCLVFLSSLAACGHVHPADVAMAPNPPPPPGYRASCSSLPLPFNAFITACTPAQSEQVAIVHAKS
jgi:hypothetical protein